MSAWRFTGEGPGDESLDDGVVMPAVDAYDCRGLSFNRLRWTWFIDSAVFDVVCESTDCSVAIDCLSTEAGSAGSTACGSGEDALSENVILGTKSGIGANRLGSLLTRYR